LSPTAHTMLPLASTPFRSFAVPSATGVQLAPPSMVRARNPFVPAIHPFCPSTNRTAFSCSVVPLTWALHAAPPSVDCTTVPPLPTAIPVPPPSHSIRRRFGVPLTTASDQVPPRSALRHTFPLSPTTTMFQPHAATSRSALSPSCVRLHATPPLTER